MESEQSWEFGDACSPVFPLFLGRSYPPVLVSLWQPYKEIQVNYMSLADQFYSHNYLLGKKRILLAE